MCGLSKKKMPYLHLIDEAIELIKTEVRIVNLHIKYPEQFQQHANKLFLSPLQLADKTSLINIMEIVSGLFLSKRKLEYLQPVITQYFVSYKSEIWA